MLDNIENNDVLGETLIWCNMNDPRNMEVIKKEQNDIRNYLPRIHTLKVIEEIKEIDIEQIIKNILLTPYNTSNILTITKNQSTILTYLVTKFKATEPDDLLWNNFKNYLLWVLESSEYILNKTSLVIIPFPTDKVYRSSYKFCIQKENCLQVYNNALNNTMLCRKECSGDHFVHNKIIQDIKSLMILENNNGSIYQDLRLGLITIDFVLKHMVNELDVFNLYLSNDLNFNIDNYYLCGISKPKSKKR